MQALQVGTHYRNFGISYCPNNQVRLLTGAWHIPTGLVMTLLLNDSFLQLTVSSNYPNNIFLALVMCQALF